MDAYEATRIVFSEIKTMDPENIAKIMGLFYSDMDCRRPNSNGADSTMFPYMNWGAGVSGNHRRSCSMADLYLSSDVASCRFRLEAVS